MIPKQLRNSKLRFVKVNKKSKIPIEKGWRTSKAQYRYDDPELINWLKKGNNVGITTTKGFIILDADSKETREYALKNLPETFTVQSSVNTKAHFYYFCEWKSEKTKLYFQDGHSDVRSIGFQTLTPPSIHPSGMNYKVIIDSPIATITQEELMKKLEPIFKKVSQTPLQKTNWTKDTSRSADDWAEIKRILRKNPRLTFPKVDEKMTDYLCAKWIEAPIEYKKFTYSKARKQVLEAKETRIGKDDNVDVVVIAVKPPYEEEKKSKEFIEDFKTKQADVGMGVYICNNYNNYTKYIDFYDNEDYLITTIWALGTHCFEIFDYYPIIVVNAPKNSGKTKLCTVIARTTRNGRIINNVSQAYLYRLIERDKPTLLLDDIELLSNKEKAGSINNILRNGWYRGGIVGRCHDVTLEPTDFKVYCPKLVSNIQGLSDDAVESRSIPISLIRSTKKSVLNLDVAPDGNDDTLLAYHLSVNWVCDNNDRINDVYNSIEAIEGLNGRDWQLWKPLLALAKVLDETDGSLEGGDCFSKMKEYAIKKCKIVLEDDMESFDMKILFALNGLVKFEKYYSIQDVKDSMDIVCDNRDVGHALKRLKLAEGKSRKASGTVYLLNPDMIADKWDRYCKK